MAAFALARALGADAVELDVRRTADDVLVVHHDVSVAAGLAPIRSTTRRELPAHVPTLDDALDACAGMWVSIEIKNDPREPDFDPDDTIADLVVAALATRGESHRWLISSFRIETVDRCRELDPAIRTAWVVLQAPNEVAARLAAAGHAAVHPWYEIDHAFVEECHAAGVGVNVWTCDDPDVMRRLAGCGVDGICTNVPDVAIAALRL